MPFTHLFTVGGNLATINTTALGYMYYNGWYEIWWDNYQLIQVATRVYGDYTDAFTAHYPVDSRKNTLVIHRDNAVTANSMFDQQMWLTAVPDNSFNNVVEANLMFRDNQRLPKMPENSFANVVDAQGMFHRCYRVQDIPASNKFDKVTGAADMFNVCSSLSSIPADSFNNVIDSRAMFAGCYSLSSVPSNKFNTVISAWRYVPRMFSFKCYTT